MEAERVGFLKADWQRGRLLPGAVEILEEQVSRSDIACFLPSRTSAGA
jgi:hypothetical protein